VAILQGRQIVLNAEDDPDGRILEEFADFWKIPYSRHKNHHEEQVLLTTGKKPFDKTDNNPIIVSPSGQQGFREIAEELGVQVASKNTLIRLPVAPSIHVSIRTDLREFSGNQVEPVMTAGEAVILFKIARTNVHLLSIDLAGEYRRLVLEAFEDTPSRRFRIASRLPLSYQSIPQSLRNRVFRSPKGVEQLTEDRIGPVECLRTILLASLVLVSGPIPRISFWRQRKKFALVVTHDVETRDGLERGSSQLLRVEQSLGIRSTWNVPSDRYPLSPQHLERLTGSGEIGVHDTKHDGQLVFLNLQDTARRLARCKKRLEELTDQSIRGFRAPLLQHSMLMLKALSKAGYEFDSSCPSWEILSPTSLRPHGVGTIFPFYTENVLEIPVSLPQDHQLIRVAGQKPSEAVDLLVRISRWIRSIGGACILLTHPDYEFGMPEYAREYQRLLENFRSDSLCEIMTLGDMADWWNVRNQAQIQVRDNRVSIISDQRENEVGDLQTELVTGFGEDGFGVVNLS
jgi:peptidoglycan/xylan/chitin deacetylase (PgdA/CDA1 family)